MKDYFDRDEMSRPGHHPTLLSDRYGVWSSCSCGWSEPRVQTMAPAVEALWGHVADVDRKGAPA